MADRYRLTVISPDGDEASVEMTMRQGEHLERALTLLLDWKIRSRTIRLSGGAKVRIERDGN